MSDGGSPDSIVSFASNPDLVFLSFFLKLIDFKLCWIFVAVCWLSLVAWAGATL